MSLINQMLRDLQDRKGVCDGSAATPSAFSEPRSGRLPKSLLMLVVGLGGALLLWWLAGQMTTWFSSPPETVKGSLTAQSAPVVTVQSEEGVTSQPKTPLLRPEVLPGGVSAQSERTSRGVYQTAEESFRAAQLFYQEGRDSSAVAALQICLDLEPRHFAAREFLADIYEMTSRFDAAIALLREGVTLAPAHAVFKKRAAALLAGQGDLAAAVQTLMQTGLPKVDQAPDVHALLASYYLRLNEPFLAAQTYRNLLTVWPKSGAFWAGLGRALDQQGDAAAARKAYLQALAAGDLPLTLAQFAEQRLQDGRWP